MWPGALHCGAPGAWSAQARHLGEMCYSGPACSSARAAGVELRGTTGWPADHSTQHAAAACGGRHARVSISLASSLILSFVPSFGMVKVC